MHEVLVNGLPEALFNLQSLPAVMGDRRGRKGPGGAGAEAELYTVQTLSSVQVRKAWGRDGGCV